jgi:hypothetical protein
MKLSEVINESGLIEEMNRICGTTNNIYSKKSKIARLNNALDRYFSIAFSADRRGSFDDINNTSAPIESQTLVTATNKYKFSAFTNEIQNVLRMSVLNGQGLEVPLKHEVMDDIINFGEQYKTTVTGTPEYWTRLGDYVYLRPCPLTGNFTAALGLKAYVERTSTKFDFNTITSISNGANALITAPVVHGLVAGDTVIFETDGALPTGLTADTVQYFVIAAGLTTVAFEVSTTLGGAAVTTSSAGSGNHTFVKTSKVPGIPSIHHTYLARHASIPFLMEKSLPQLNSILKLVGSDNPQDPFYGGDELAIKKHFANREKDIDLVIEPEVIESV